MKLAVDKEGNPTGFFERGVWLRGKIDYFQDHPGDRPRWQGHPRRCTYRGLQDGQTKEDWTQLMLSAYMIFCHYKKVMAVRTEFLWTEYNDTSHENPKRDEIMEAMARVTPRVRTMEAAALTLKHVRSKTQRTVLRILPCKLV